MMLGFWFAAVGASQIPNIDGDDLTLIASPDLSIWVAVLLIQSIPYAAAVFVSLINTLAVSGEWIGETGLRQRVPVTDRVSVTEVVVPTAATVLEPVLAASSADLPALAVESRD